MEQIRGWIENLQINFEKFIEYYGMSIHDILIVILIVIVAAALLRIVLGSSFRVGKRLKEAKLTNEKIDTLNKNIEELIKVSREKNDQVEKIFILIENQKIHQEHQDDLIETQAKVLNELKEDKEIQDASQTESDQKFSQE